MNSHSRIQATVALLALAAGCAQKSAAPVVDLAAEEKAIWDRSAEWMQLAQSRDAATIVNSVYLQDAITLFDGELRTGSPEIQAGMERELAAMPASTIAWTTTKVKVAAAGDMAWETGAFTMDPDGPGEAAPVSGNFVTVWSKADGAWRVAVDSGSAAKAAPAESAAAPAAG